MKRLVLVFALFALTACTGDSNLPNPSGKGSFRALNAIANSPQIAFRIETELLASVNFREVSTTSRFDDFEYTFNFEIALLGASEPTLIAREVLKVDVGQDYTFVLTGDLLSPDVTIWEGSERAFDDAATVFETRFAHTASSVGDIDVYFAPDGTAPVLGEQRGTLSFGEILPPIDIETGDYVLTVTTAGDPQDVLLQTAPVTYGERNRFIIPFFDGDEQNTGPFVAQLINIAGGASTLTDVGSPPTIRFIQASFDLANADVYDDEMLMNQVLSDHAFGDVTGDLPAAIGQTTYTYTTVGDTSAVLFESGINTIAGLHYNFLVIGEEGERFAQAYVPDRRRVSTFAKLRPYHAALNHNEVDLYVVDAGTPIDEESPILSEITYSLISPTLAYDTGVYDLYLTVPGEKTIIAGPTQIDVTVGDNVEIIFFDTVDPATAEIRIIPNTTP